MKHLILTTLIAATLLGQYSPDPPIPCKPLGQMAQHLDQLARASERTPGYPYDVHHYDLSFDIDVDAEQIQGITEIHFISEEEGLDSLVLDFTGNLIVDSLELNASEWGHTGDLLTLFLDAPVDVDESSSVRIYYHGSPVPTGLQAFAFGSQGGAPLISTLSEPYGARTWWPCKDIPTDKADSLRVSITVPDDLIAVSNGMLQTNTDNGDGTRTFVWQHDYPITTYLVSLTITNYSYWSDIYHFADGDSMPLEYWVYPNNYNATTIARWRLTEGMMVAFDDMYGKYPFHEEKYGMAQFGWGGAMEHQTCSSMGSSSEGIIAHELAHQWWGDMVTCADFHHIWINEGFATYSEALYYEYTYGEEAFHNEMAGNDLPYVGSIYRTDTTSVWAIFDYIVYGKGAWFLHMLRHMTGDEDFFETLAQFRSEFQFSHASTEDFQGIVETVTGTDYDWFFSEWIYGSGRPEYTWWWSVNHTDSLGQANVQIHIEQAASAGGSLFKMPIDFHAAGEGHDTVFVLWDSTSSQDFYVTLPFVPTEILLDPEDWILKREDQISSTDDHAKLPFSFQLMESYPNPFNNAVRINYQTQARFQGSLQIHDLRGREVYRRGLQHEHAGHYDLLWTGMDTEGAEQHSGIYIVRLIDEAGGSSSGKLTLLK